MVYNIKDDNGNVTVEPNKINQYWQNYFENLLNSARENTDEGTEKIEAAEKGEQEEEEISREELEEALKKMTNDKILRCDGLPIELIKEEGNILYWEYCKKVWNEEIILQEWGRAIILPIYQEKGGSKKRGNYKDIFRISHVAKLYKNS